MKRRFLFKKALVLLSASIFYKKASAANNPEMYKVTYITNLPYQMSETEYKKLRSPCRYNKFRENLIKKLKRERKILSTDYLFTKNKSIFSLVFQSKKAHTYYEKQIKHIQKHSTYIFKEKNLPLIKVTQNLKFPHLKEIITD